MQSTYNPYKMFKSDKNSINSREAAMIIDNDGVIEYANNALCEVFSYTNEELEGNSIDIILKEEYKLGSKQLLLRGIGGKESFKGMTTISLVGIDKNKNDISLKARYKKIGNQKRLIIFERLLY